MSERDPNEGALSGPQGGGSQPQAGDVLNEVRQVAESIEQRMEVKASYHEGPLPHHESFASYEQTLPGCADRIVTMTEKEQAERHKLQKISLYASIGIRYLGMLFAAGLSLVALLKGAQLIEDDKNIEGLVLLFAGLSPIVAAFLFRRNLPPGPRPPMPPGNGQQGG